MKTAKTQLDREVDKKRQQKATIEGQLKAVENAIDKIRNTDTDAIADAAQKMKAKIEEKVANMEAIDAKIQTTRNHAKNLEHNLFSIRSEERDLRATQKYARPRPSASVTPTSIFFGILTFLSIFGQSFANEFCLVVSTKYFCLHFAYRKSNIFLCILGIQVKCHFAKIPW